MGTFVAALILLAVIAAASASLIRDKKRGKCSCDESPGARTVCGSCSGCGACTDGRGARAGGRDARKQ